MRKRLSLTTLATLMAVITIFAVPAKPGLKKKVTLRNGSTVELTLKGDEHFSYYTDAEGNAYKLKDRELIRLTAEEVSEQWTAMRQERLAVGKMAGRRAAKRVGEVSTTTGTQRGLVILLEYQDVKFVTPNPQETFTRFFNEEGYSEGGMAGSVRDYFKKQSYGKLTIDFDVVGPFTVSENMAYYGKHYTDDYGKEHNDTHPALMVAEVVDAAYKAGVDFSKYDWDNDGEVDQVFVIYAGYAEAQGAAAETIWPHEWSLSAENATREHNGVTINTYGCSAELMGKSGSIMDGIGTACHEFSHCLGLPDMYDTEGDNYGMGSWDVMCAGSYNGNSCTPAGYTSYERWFSGWMEPVEIKEMTRITDMPPLATNPVAYVLYNEKNKDEYYLLENRQPVDFDKKLYGHGMLILHVDYSKNAWSNNTVNTVANRQRMTIIAADDDYSERSASKAGDPWPGTTGNTMLGNHTTPAAILYNVNTDGTKFMNKQIDNITEDTEAMTVSFVACRPEMGIPANIETTELATGNGFTLSWPAVTGAVGYEIELTMIDKAASDPNEALLREYDFSGCYSKTAGFTDIGSKLSSYGLTSWTGSKLFTTPQKLRIGTSSSTGYIQTPSWWLAPSSQQVTFVMGADVFTSGTSVKGTLKFESAKDGGTSADVVAENVEFEVTGNSKQVFSFTIPNQKDLFRLRISPKSQMYLNYFAIYDGTWTAEQLGINNAPALAPRRAAVITTYSSDTNSYTFANMNTNKRYVFRVRALGEENTYSQWSAEQTFEFSATGMMDIRTDVNAPVRYFDLSGHEVDATARGVIIIKQGNTTRKVVR